GTETGGAGEDEAIAVDALCTCRYPDGEGPDPLAQQRALDRHEDVGEGATSRSPQRRRRGQHGVPHPERAERGRWPALPDAFVVDAHAGGEPAGAVAQPVVVAARIAVDAGPPPASLPRKRAVDIQERVA